MMNILYRDRRFQLIMLAYIASSIGSGITMIAVPWLLVTSENGNAIFGYVTISMTVVTFMLTPFIGGLIDRMSRKRLLIVSVMLSLLVLLAFSIMGFVGLTYEVWHYIIIYLIGNLYFSVFYPTMFALNQEVFEKGQYKVLNGAMEVQGQLSIVIAGAVASVLLLHWDLQYILLMNVFMFAAAVYFYVKLDYEKKGSEESVGTEGAVVSGGLTYLKGRPAMFWLLLFSVMPFIGVMVTNYLFPVYLADVLVVGGNIYGIQGMVYGVGAVVTGLVAPLVIRRIGEGKAIVVGMVIFTAAISGIIFANVPVYLVLMFFIAVGNSGTRVARNSFLMDQVPNELMGRIDGVFRSLGLLFRIVLLGVFTGMVSAGLILACFMVLAGVLGISTFVVMVAWRRGLAVSEESRETGVRLA